MSSRGQLYLIATPLGNLEDFCFRAIKVIKMCDYVYTEDTRVTSLLLKHYQIEKTLFSYHSFNEKSKTDTIINQLLDGKNIALISDAGYPLISDPGNDLVAKAVSNEIKILTIPAVSAFLSALLVSGLDISHFYFHGFLKKDDFKKELQELKNIKVPIVFYESKLRILNTLKHICEIWGDRKLVLVREISKLYEESIYTSVYEEITNPHQYIGEYVLVVEGKKADEEDLKAYQLLDLLILQGLSRQDIIKNFSSYLGLSNNQISSYIKQKTPKLD
jgi:16S rRNA (cytidine1402-2'-O)-methyltransferase